MTKLPRDVDGLKLVKALSRFGYRFEWETGSHMICTTLELGKHRISIPRHSPVKPCTFADILDEVAAHHGITRAELLQQLKL